MQTKPEDLKKLLNELQNDKDCRFEFDYLSENNPDPFQWKTVLEGTQDTVYENGYYMLKIIFSGNYPIERPNVYFLNKIFHPHVGSDGWACIEPPNNDVVSCIETVENMFIQYDKNIDHAFSGEPRRLCETDKEKFKNKAREWVRTYAKLEDIDKFYDL